ncbi:MAG: HAD-IA family hydrolase, partial [Hyphomonadaceae bacterium]
MRVEFILWDIGRVLLDWEPERAYVSHIADPVQRAAFLANVCNMDWHCRHDAGVSFADNAAPLIEKHPEHAANIRAWGANWFDMFDGYIDGTPALFDRLEATGIAQYALSNMPAEIWPEMKIRFPLLARFEDAIISGEEGLIKPDPTLYKIALARMGNPPAAHVLFIDDSLPNIDAARRLGFQTHHLKTA